MENHKQLKRICIKIYNICKIYSYYKKIKTFIRSYLLKICDNIRNEIFPHNI